jgi:para-aminobenzoate synthetase/4-amino-4-deoxychorismate lyase
MNRWHRLPAEVYALVDETPAAALLECAPAGTDGAEQERVSRVFLEPVRVLEAREPGEIPGLFAEVESAVAAGRYAAGYFAYECGICFEPKAGMRRGEEPLAWLGIYERPYCFDHPSGEFVGGAPAGLERFARGAGGGTDARELAADLCGDPLTGILTDIRFGVSEAEYARRIAAIHEWIRAGDVYQLNFTAPLRVGVEGSAAALYKQLRARQPAPYGAFLHTRAGRKILSFSPELFFRVEGAGEGRRITTRPMKGTAPRGRTTREDQAQAEWLQNDEKNRSENLMIVDLLRNDLGRLARFGSVRVDELFTVERYPTLWQMTSTISGTLRREVGFEEIFRALFPCGSVTGAPKVRAMQLIGEIEAEPRGVYTGAIGYFSRARTVFNVAIRTLEVEGAEGRMGLGSGIVIDSDAAAEYGECLLKAEFLTRAAERFSLIESLLWREGYPLLEMHLDRLTDSAEYFGYPCERETVRAALEEYARGFEGGPARKVRLLLDDEGQISITDEALAADGERRAVRVRMARERTDSADRMLLHKTTQRALYARAFGEAVRDGFDEALFQNERGEVTEGAISNVFAVKDGRWRTPPVECGLLAGVYRRHLLGTRAEIEEQVLRVEDLREADEVYLANAVRGLRRAEIDWPQATPDESFAEGDGGWFRNDPRLKPPDPFL